MTYNNMDDTAVQIPRERFEARQRELAQITCSRPSPSSTSSKDRTLKGGSTTRETKKAEETVEGGELMTVERTDLVMTGEEMMTIKSTTVNSIILKDAIEQDLLQGSPYPGQVVVASIDNIQALR